MKIYKYLFFIGLAFLSVSCIDWGLEDLPNADGAEILDFDFEYRYATTNENGFEKMEYVTLSTVATIGESNVDNVVTIPEPSGSFTDELAAQITLSNIVGYANLSDAAKIEPVGGASTLGTVGNFSGSVQYKVTAASGQTKTWTVTTTLAP